MPNAVGLVNGRIINSISHVGKLVSASSTSNRSLNFYERTVVRAGLSTVPVVPWEGAPRRKGTPADQLLIFLPRCFDV